MKNEIYSKALRASELMSRPVEMVRMKDSLRDVACLFNDKNMSAAVVIDQNNKPVGVITKTDLSRYQKEKDDLFVAKRGPTRTSANEYLPAGFHAIEDDTVEHWMTPAIFDVEAEATVREIAQCMVRYGVHHVFVRGAKSEPVIGVVSSFDILRQVASQ